MKKFKRLIAIVTVMLFALSIIVPAFAQDESTQETSSMYDQAAKVLQEKGILKGNEQGDLMLDKTLTRAEILAMIIRATGQEDVVKDYVYAEQSFKDVPKDHWAFAYVEAGKDLGIVNGYPDGTFKPDKPVKFEELAKMLVAAKGESPAAGKWPINYVRKALDLGLFNGIEDEVGIGDVVIRGQAAVAFQNAFFQPEKTIVVKDVKAVANDTIEVYVDAYLGNEPATLEDGDVIPLDFEIKDASDPSKTVAVTLIDSQASDFGAGKLVLKTQAQTPNATYKVFYKGQDTGKTFVGVAVPLQVAKVEALNYKEIKVTFNREVDNDTYATTTGNYTVKVGTATVSVSNAALSSDKKSVTLLLADKFSNNDTVTVTVSKNVGIAQDYTATITNFTDVTAPVVENVVGVGLMKVIVTFSEPVEGADNPANYLIDNAYTAATVSADSSGRIYTITFYSPLAAGNHTIQFVNIKDYAGYGLVTPVKTFALAADNTPISTPTVISATQTEVKLKFNKDIARIYNVSASPQGTFVDASYDGSIVTLKFGNEPTTALPASGATIKFDVVDASGITATGISVTVVPTVDTTRPAFVTYTLNSENEIVITYSKDVRVNAGETYQLKKSDGTIYTPTSVEYAESNVYNKVKLTFSGLSAGTTYTLSISGVVDNTPLKNQIIPTDVTVTIIDKSAPTPSYIYKILDDSGKVAKLYVVFNETVTATTATNPANYTLIKGSTSTSTTSTSVASISSAYLTLLADGKTVVIDFKNNSQDDNIQSVIVANVSDLAGNTLSGAVVPVGVATAGAPTVESVVYTGKTTLELTLSGNKLVNIAPVDFVVYYKDNNNNDVVWAYPSNVSYDSQNNKLTLTLSKEINTDGTITVDNVVRPVYFKLNPNGVATQDIFRNKLTSKVAGTMTDKAAPLITGVSAGDKKGTIKITFSEAMQALDLTTLKNAVILYKDNAKVNYTNATWADSKTLIIGTDSKDKMGELDSGVYTVVIDAGQFKDVSPAMNVMAYVAPSSGIYVTSAATTITANVSTDKTKITLTFANAVSDVTTISVVDANSNAVNTSFSRIFNTEGKVTAIDITISGGGAFAPGSYTITVNGTDHYNVKVGVTVQ